MGIIKPDKTTVSLLEDLRAIVETANKLPSITLRGKTYRCIKDTVMTAKRNGWEFGYKVDELPMEGFYKRKIFIKNLEDKIENVPEKEREGIVAAVFDTLLDKNSPEIEIEQIAPDCMLITQIFQIMFLKEMKPNLVN